MGFGDELPAGYPRLFIAGYVSGTFGIWRSDDNGTTWSQIGGFPNGNYDFIADIDGAKDGSGLVYLGFQGSGYAYGVPPVSNPSGVPLPPVLLP